MAINNNIFFHDPSVINLAISKDYLSKHFSKDDMYYYMTIIYLRKHMDMFGEVTMSLEKLANESGYQKSGYKTINKFRNIISQLINSEYIYSNQDISTVKTNEIYTLKINRDNCIFIIKGFFMQISIYEYDRIININSKVSKAILLAVYLYIKQFIGIRRFSFPAQSDMMAAIGISQPTLSNALSDLKKNEIIYIIKNIYVQDYNNLNNLVPARNVYLIDKYDIDYNYIANELESIYGRKVIIKK